MARSLARNEKEAAGPPEVHRQSSCSPKIVSSPAESSSDESANLSPLGNAAREAAGNALDDSASC
jgi:hypothetical protein